MPLTTQNFQTSAPKRIMITGGDGFIGWPLSLRLSAQGHQVMIVDSLVRREIDLKNGYRSISPITSIETRIERWHELTSKDIIFEKVDIAQEKEKFFQIFEHFLPDTVVHLAEQKSAPFSMKSLSHIDYTFTNNTQSTLNILLAVMQFQRKCHIVHIGTMGVYGYGVVRGLEIPEGYCMAKINCVHEDKCECQPVEIVHPYYPGSVYHMTKCLDNLTLLNFQKFFGLRITELHQGIVWGVSTPETKMHPDLCNRIDVDSDFGTVLNRFCSQVACGHPITIYGTGEQTRAFININDSIKCLSLVINSDEVAESSKINILNQVTSTHSLNSLKDLLLKMYPEATCDYIKNPRKELPKNELKVCTQKFESMGHQGQEINPEALEELVNLCRENKDRFLELKEFVEPISFWKDDYGISREHKPSTDGEHVSDEKKEFSIQNENPHVNHDNNQFQQNSIKKDNVFANGNAFSNNEQNGK